jgi:hypothetical protein
MKITKYFIGAGAAAFALILAIPGTTQAVVQCDFTRDLEVGSEGEDVRCLQKFLNEAGFVISSEGIGSPGKETPQLGGLTKKALTAWQVSNNLLPATGNFGPKSRQKYNEFVKGGSGVTVIPTVPGMIVTPIGTETMDSLRAQVISLKAQNSQLKLAIEDSKKEDKKTNASSTGSAEEQKARTQIKRALEMLEEADDQLGEGDDDADYEKAEKEYEDAEEDILDAMMSFFRNNFENSIKAADKAYENALDAFEAAGGESDEDELDNKLEELDDQIKDAKKTIDDAEEAGDDTDKAEDLLDKAEDKLDDAEKAFKDDDFDKAEDLADDTEDLIDDALSAIGEDADEEGADKAIDDAKDAINDAKDKIEDAEADGDNVEDAQNLLDEAEEKLDKAKEEFEDEDYDKAIDYAEDAEKLAKDAEDEL